MNNPLRRVNLPRMVRPNLVARLYMLAVAKGTAQIAWLIPTSSTARILESGGTLAYGVLVAMSLGLIAGLLDILLNDVLQVAERRRGPGAFQAFADWLMRNRSGLCFVIGSCYLVQAYAGMGVQIAGIGALVWYYIEVAAITGLLFWSLRFLDAAEFHEPPNAT